MSILKWKGRSVPWVTRWTNEVRPESPEPRSDGKRLHLSYGNRDIRDSHDDAILWQHEGILRGGEPQFSKVSTYRQRASMKHRLCQVCGTKIPDGPFRWMFGPGQLQESDGIFITLNAPTCETCIDIAANECPHLRKTGYQVALVEEYALWGVYGNVTTLTHNGTIVQGKICVPYGAEIPPHMAVLAQQQVAQLTKFTLEAG